MSDIIRSEKANPQIDGRFEVHEVSLSTTTGAGSVVLSYDRQFDAPPVVVATAEGIDDVPVFISARGASQATLEVTGSAVADGTYTVNVHVAGQ